MCIHLIGVDCATKAEKVGVAFGKFQGEGLVIDDIVQCSDREKPAEVIVERIQGIKDKNPILLAFDAPLGWPLPFCNALLHHKAGEEFTEIANDVFRRETDIFIREYFSNLHPLEVGANFIARTAHAALVILGELRYKLQYDLEENFGLKDPVPLAWKEPLEHPISAIEVYPAATLTAHDIINSGYKTGEEQEKKRKKIVEKLKEKMGFSEGVNISSITKNDDILDAVVCLLAAADFVKGEVLKPRRLIKEEEEDRSQRVPQERLNREGWIWVREP